MGSLFTYSLNMFSFLCYMFVFNIFCIPIAMERSTPIMVGNLLVGKLPCVPPDLQQVNKNAILLQDISINLHFDYCKVKHTDT